MVVCSRSSLVNGEGTECRKELVKDIFRVG